MSAARMRCMIQGCNAWEFDPQIHMCRNCIQSMAQVAAAARKYLKHPVLKPDMYVTQAIASPHYLGLQEGELCDVLDILEDNQSIIVKAKDGRIGYFNIDFIATEEEVCVKAMKHESLDTTRLDEIRHSSMLFSCLASATSTTIPNKHNYTQQAQLCILTFLFQC
eukprot:TRINITY_DN7830_c0_g1_i2.p1 TRINITY_DN7830_c0_g1~~TRINITY_DN7830_c0_g1_i2.p1  ORF type:complete len:165 (+),score=24.04 TRINITY_DN7830_c0_g1_i2:112-606(+)